ncbi:MAG: Ig-like domain-containing protein [Bacteroidia bacterium]
MLNRNTLFLLFICFACSCANIVQPSGGAVDTVPPAIVHENPVNNSTSFSGRTIELCFDEYVQIKEAQKNIIISPPLEKNPEIKAAGRCINIIFEEGTLQNNTTYTLQFLGAIADIHEGAVLGNYVFSFSTGNILDTLSINGVISNALTLKKMSGYSVGLYKRYNDSSAFNTKPDYLGLTNQLGIYRIKGIGAGAYHLVAFEDKNNNRRLDVGEEVAFSSSEHSGKDTVQNVKLLSFTQPLYTPGKLIDTIHSAKNQFELVFYQPEYTPVVESKNFFSYHRINDKYDTLVVQFIQDTSSTGSSELKYTIGEKTNSLFLTASKTNTPLLHIENITKDYLPGDTCWLITSNAIKSVKIDSIRFQTDTSYHRADVLWNSGSNRIGLLIKKDLVIGALLKLRLGNYSITDVYGNTSKPMDFFITVSKDIDFGGVQFLLKNSAKKNGLLQLLDSKGGISYSIPVQDQKEIVINKIIPGSYTVRWVDDRNKNGRWDAGNIILGKQPERVFYLSTPLELRPDWFIEGNVIDVDAFK